VCAPEFVGGNFENGSELQGLLHGGVSFVVFCVWGALLLVARAILFQKMK